jgi:hypothetical protein
MTPFVKEEEKGEEKKDPIEKLLEELKRIADGIEDLRDVLSDEIEPDLSDILDAMPDKE